ncbi:MAG: EAL domain-containing protein [Gammaproteobacteria bacterium]|nr:EAL domain-containing protein [Gammaproteobacteria bacterium]
MPDPAIQQAHGASTFRTVNACLEYRAGRLTAPEGDVELRTVLQPIFSVRHQRPVGCEALIRGRDNKGREVPAWKILDGHTPDAELRLDRLCAVLHARNFSAIAADRNWLFLNLSAAEFNLEAWADGFFVELLQGCNLAPYQIVVEILESPVAERIDLVEVIAYFRELGVLVALDDFGAGHSNFERIWRLKPDIVKLDRSLIVLADRDRAMRRSLPSIVDILHQNRCLVVAEGIETERQALNVMDAGVDLVQGFFFAHPFEISEQFLKRRINWASLQDGLQDTVGSGTLMVRGQLISHLARMYELAGYYQREGHFRDAAERLFELPGVIRCYAIDETGRQRDENVNSPRMSNHHDRRLAPLASAEGASWYTRPYFRRAKQYPGEIQISHEYLSCADASMCITLSVLVDSPNGPKVLCCDVLADAN